MIPRSKQKPRAKRPIVVVHVAMISPFRKTRKTPQNHHGYYRQVTMYLVVQTDATRHPTNPHTTFEVLNPSHFVSELHSMCRSPDFQAVNLWKGRSGIRGLKGARRFFFHAISEAWMRSYMQQLPLPMMISNHIYLKLFPVPIFTSRSRRLPNKWSRHLCYSWEILEEQREERTFFISSRSSFFLPFIFNHASYSHQTLFSESSPLVCDVKGGIFTSFFLSLASTFPYLYLLAAWQQRFTRTINWPGELQLLPTSLPAC